MRLGLYAYNTVLVTKVNRNTNYIHTISNLHKGLNIAISSVVKMRHKYLKICFINIRYTHSSNAKLQFHIIQD